MKSLWRLWGGCAKNIETDWKQLNSSFEKEKIPTIHEIKGRFNEFVETIGDRKLTKDDLRDLRQSFEVKTGWSVVKKGGLNNVASGDPYSAAVNILSELRQLGIFIVEKGELERFAPEVPKHGPSWLIGALEQGWHKPDKSHAGKFVSEVRDFIRVRAMEFG